MHAHVDVTIDARELVALRAVIFAASRSLNESKTALDRQPGDQLTVWGLGVHPASKLPSKGSASTPLRRSSPGLHMSGKSVLMGE